MKHLLLIFFVLCALFARHLKACPGGTFSTQASIDNFPLNNPGCTVITGDIIIEDIPGTSITNLNGFAGITKIIGNFRIFRAGSLTSLAGLSSLKSVELDPSAPPTRETGMFYINQCPLLTTLAGLSSLESVVNLQFSYSGLANLVGLNNLKKVGGITLISLPIVDLTGLGVLENCTSLYITENKSLTSLDGFPNNIPDLAYIVLLRNAVLASVNVGRGITSLTLLELGDNPALADLSDFNEIQSFGRLVVNGVGGINSFEGLDACTSIGQLYVAGPAPSFSGLENVTRLGHFYLSVTPGNRSFEGLSGVKSIGRWDVVGSTVDDFSGLASLESVRDFRFNRIGVTSLSGLDDLKVDSIANVAIHDSFSLTDCNVRSLCIYLAKPTAVSNIERNGIGCESKAAIVNSAACMTVFPVTFVSFRVQRVSEGNKLSWQTASEINNKGFEIERSEDGRMFTSIGYEAGSGDTQTLKSYSFTDSQPLANSYYRLKQWDWDGSFRYSKIVWVRADRSMATAYPNPAGDFIYIKNAVDYSPVSIRNLQGFSVKESTVLPGKPIDTRALQNGLYMISIGDEILKVWVNH
ncbi:T9SS type A sorting domain-containing protein [Dyadobacter sp. 676]|uniref:T9SS type A sorting domain-containing protein n=1 Tax=Dyadobacter sp. 676 TaxID=3088362 RepID=A0AAU8FFI8_9BACT